MINTIKWIIEWREILAGIVGMILLLIAGGWILGLSLAVIIYGS